MQTLSSGPQGGEQGWARMGHPKLLPVTTPPPTTCSFCFTTVIMFRFTTITVFSWAPTEAQWEVWQPAFLTRE